MKLSAIKENIVEHLKKTSIDDFYADPQLESVKKLFSEITGLNTDEEIKSYLYEQFPETRLETYKKARLNEIKFLNNEISHAENDIKSLHDEVNKIELKLKDIRDKLNNIPKQQNQLNSELSEIENEINQIKPLSAKSPYDKHLSEIENNKIHILNSLENIPKTYSSLEIELLELTNLLNTKKESIESKQADYNKTKENSIELKNEIDQLENDKIEHFDNEYEALQFLFSVLLNKNITVGHEFIEEKTGRMIKDNWGDTMEEYIEVEVETIVERESSFQELKNIIQEFTQKGHKIPNDWRKILLKTLSKLNISFTGNYNTSNLNYAFSKENAVFYRDKKALTPVDISALLATKIAVKTNYSLRIEDNKIALALAGGIMAIISLREKSDTINAFQQEAIEFYTSSNYGNYDKQTLYYQKGYADSEIQIEIPKQYYILSELYVIEIEYISAPILMNSNNLIKLIPDISGKVKREDEIAEELKRQESLNDYWYDDNDDDDDY